VKRLAAYGEPVEGTPFGRYRLIELLGRGGMGEVWRAHDTDTDRIVAIKVLPVNFSESEDFKQRFRREAHAAARLYTPHVVPIHNYGEIDGRLYVDMRLVEGRDLQAVLADGPLEPSRAVRIIEGIASALHAAHKVGLVHRDVKPSNILLDEDDFAYLIDFGIARAADETRLTKSGNAIGTFQYIAPERLGTRAQEDARADIYSLACVLYECLTGSPPFDEETMASLIAAHLNTPPPQPSSTQPNVPAQFDDVIATGMAKDPEHRYQTTTELANAAHRALALAAGADTMHAETPPHAEQAATADTADRLFGDFGEFVRQEPPTKLVKPATPPSKVAKPATPPWVWPLIAAIVVILAAAGTVGYLLTGRNSQPSTTSQPSTISQPATISQPSTTSRQVATSRQVTVTTSRQVTPVAVAALDGLLLSPAEVNTAMGATAMTVTGSVTTTWDDSTTVSDKACLPIAGPGQDKVYAGSRWTAMRGHYLQEPGDAFTHIVVQGVVLFRPRTTRPRSSPPLRKAGWPAPTGSTPSPRWPANPVWCGSWGRSPTRTPP
jgi:serine/threonine-protein kinase